MKVKILVLATLLFVVSAHAQWRTVPFNKDKWTSQNGAVIQYDKLEHFVGSFVLNASIEHYVSQKHGWKYSIALGFVWEIKDALVPYEKYGKLGGEGFSSKDMLADIGGVVLNHYLNKLMNKFCGG
jgi:hypothetical protein